MALGERLGINGIPTLIALDGRMLPGAGLNVDLSTVDTKSIASFTAKAKDQSTIQFLMEIIPSTVVGAFANGEILQVLFFAILFAFGLQALGERGDGVLRLIDTVSHVCLLYTSRCV